MNRLQVLFKVKQANVDGIVLDIYTDKKASLGFKAVQVGSSSTRRVHFAIILYKSILYESINKAGRFGDTDIHFLCQIRNGGSTGLVKIVNNGSLMRFISIGDPGSVFPGKYLKYGML